MPMAIVFSAPYGWPGNLNVTVISLQGFNRLMKLPYHK
jgi:hypothetical protein